MIQVYPNLFLLSEKKYEDEKSSKFIVKWNEWVTSNSGNEVPSFAEVLRDMLIEWERL